MKTIPNFSNYCADENGFIYSKNYKRTGQQKRLNPAKDANGYLRTMLLSDDGKYKTVKVHRIVAMTFFGESHLHVNHKNGIKEDNRPDNLEYCTISENLIHAYKNNLIKRKFGEKNGNSKLTAQQVKEIRECAAQSNSRYYGRKALAEKYGVSEAHIKDIVNNRHNLWHTV